MATTRTNKFLGVYSRKKPSQTGRPAKFFVWQLENNIYAVQELDASLSPKGQVATFDANTFASAFRSEPSILAAPVTTPDFRQVIDRSRKTPADQEMAALEKARRAKQLENDLRTAFQKAIRALTRARDRKGAMAALERIAATTDGIDFSHRNMFRDFGVTLRKQSLPELALQCARRVVSLSPNDDHARFNLARILAILGRYDDAGKQLRAAIQLDPTEKAYGRLERHLAKERDFASGKQRQTEKLR